MEFTLVYQGVLRANGTPINKQRIRRKFHGQLKELWNQPPLKHFHSYLQEKPLRDIGDDVTKVILTGIEEVMS